jgi:hypothetical protein
MGTCKKCGKVVSAIYMKDDICPACRPEEGENIETQNNVEYERTGVTIEGLIGTNKVAIVDIQVPFSSMVILMVKWVLASIPAFMILFVIFYMFFSVAYSAIFHKQQNIYQEYRGY